MAIFTDEQRAFLAKSAWTAKVATTRKDGRPHVAPVWFEVDDDDTILFTTGDKTVKAANIRRDGRICICIDDQTPPFSFMIIEGTATLSAGDEKLLYWATRVGGKYMGQDQAEAYGKRNGVEGELLVRVTPTKVVFQKDLAI